nr:hypothetical protein [Desulfobacula sp.]
MELLAFGIGILGLVIAGVAMAIAKDRNADTFMITYSVYWGVVLLIAAMIN